jgi:hypothetical protein
MVLKFYRLAMFGRLWYNFRAKADWVSLKKLNNNNKYLRR